VTHHRRSPRQMAAVFGRLADDLAPQTLLADVQRAWAEVVGPAVAEQATPSAERGGVLTVSCSASVWAQELDLMAPQILSRLNERLGSASIRRLRCVAVSPRR
jgi:predicted nucleic acid-binding Zn ribbon protein